MLEADRDNVMYIADQSLKMGHKYLLLALEYGCSQYSISCCAQHFPQNVIKITSAVSTHGTEFLCVTTISEFCYRWYSELYSCAVLYC
jgi:hypothetical protein